MAIRLVAPRAANLAVEEVQAAAQDQTVFPLTMPYTPGARTLQVWINGVRQYLTTDYKETGPNEVTFVTPMVKDDLVLFRVG